jgi:hypothetical protein
LALGSGVKEIKEFIVAFSILKKTTFPPYSTSGK